MRVSAMKEEPDFEWYKSQICHDVKNLGDVGFIVDILKADEIRKLYQKNWNCECLYLLAMLDYLCRVNNMPYVTDYNDLRSYEMKNTVYPFNILILDYLSKTNENKERSLQEAIPEFLRHNIVEAEIRNIY